MSAKAAQTEDESDPNKKWTVGCVKCGQYVELESRTQAEYLITSMREGRGIFGREVNHDHDGLTVVQKSGDLSF